MTTFDVMVDYDDVVQPLAKRLHAKAHEMGLHDNTVEALEVWHGWLQYGCAKEKWLEVFDELLAEGFYTNEPPIPGVAEALRRLAWHGHRIHIVTARGYMAHGDEIRKQTYQHIEEFAIPATTVTFAKDKVWAMGRREIDKPFDFAIDDGIHNYEALDAVGVEVYLLSVPHNRDIDVPRRVATVDEFVDIVLKEAQHD